MSKNKDKYRPTSDQHGPIQLKENDFWVAEAYRASICILAYAPDGRVLTAEMTPAYPGALLTRLLKPATVKEMLAELRDKYKLRRFSNDARLARDMAAKCLENIKKSSAQFIGLEKVDAEVDLEYTIDLLEKKSHYYREIPESNCPHCGNKVSAASGDNLDPKPGDICICAWCAGINQYGPQMELLTIPEEQMEKLKRSKMWAQIEKGIQLIKENPPK
jgi:hypothetical protein